MNTRDVCVAAGIALASVLTSMPSAQPLAAQAQATFAPEIYIAPFTDGPQKTVRIAILTFQSEGVSVGKPINITNDPADDDEPCFLPDSSGLLFTSRRDGKQTDIYRYDIATKKTIQLTRTLESEHTTVVAPDQRSFTASRDGQQLWRFALDGSDPALVYEHRGRIADHAWLSPTEIAVSVVPAEGTAPTALELIDLSSGTVSAVDSNIGRSLRMRPGHGLTYVSKSQRDSWDLKELTLATRRRATLVSTVEGSEDFAWSPRGLVVMGAKSTLSFWAERNDDRWLEAGDLKKSGITSITRVAVSPDGKWIAVVSAPVRK